MTVEELSYIVEGNPEEYLIIYFTRSLYINRFPTIPANTSRI